jgi:hypothetical protein
MLEGQEVRELKEIVEELRLIRIIITPRLSAALRIQTNPIHGHGHIHGHIHGQHSQHSGDQGMPATILVGKTAQAIFQEFSGPNGTGDKLPPAGAVTFSSSNPSVASVDPSSGLITGMSAAGGSATATISGTDAANGLTASDLLTVTETAQSAVLTIVPNP